MKVFCLKILVWGMMCAPCAVQARVWDFSGVVPPGGTLRGTARLAGGGLVPGSLASPSCAAGFGLNEAVALPEAFRFAVDFTPGIAWTNEADCAESARANRDNIVYDDMYVTYAPQWRHRGLQVSFLRRDNTWTPRVFLGFGTATECVHGPAVKLAPGVRTSFAFTYDGNGLLTLDLAGHRLETMLDHCAPLASADRHKPVIGDRVGSNFHPFDGTLHRVVLEPELRARLAVYPAPGRRAFRRAESNAVVRLVARNFDTGLLTGSHLTVVQRTPSGAAFRVFDSPLPDLAPGGACTADVAVVTALHPGDMTLETTFTARDAGGVTRGVARTVPMGIGPIPGDGLMALMWGFAAPMSVLADLGFTHGLTYTQPQLSRLDESLISGVDLMQSFGLVYPEGVAREDMARRDRKGSLRLRARKPKPAPEVSNPAFLPPALQAVAKTVEALGDHPAFAGVLPVSEERDGTFPSFVTEHLAYKAATGCEVPEEVENKKFDIKIAEARFPTGVVPEDDPILAYYRWFWSGGDGWPGYTGAIGEAFRAKMAGKPFVTFWDPAVRCPPRWGSGGAVDMINQWVYAVPEPMNVAGPAEEMFAMASGRPGQKVSIMTQLICYRAQIAPMNTSVSPQPEWLTRLPRADFPTIPPDSLQEATWSMIAKPVQAIMYHGWGTIYDTGSPTGYAFTCPASTARLRELLTGVVRPLGPVLKRLGRATPDVAVFESFTTCALGGPASWGWKVPAITFFQRARLDPRVVYEETILRDGLAGVKVLYAPQCRFLTPSLIEKIKAFQAAGGILVADEELVSALKPDVRVPVVSFDRPPESDHTEDVNVHEAQREGDARTRLGTLRAKARMVAQADQLRQDLAARYTPKADSSSAEIVVYNRRDGETDYVFAINDHRTFGDYVGMWGLTMEKGLPYQGEVTMADSEGKVVAVYELSRGGAVPFTRRGDRVVVPVSYETNDGRIFLFARQKIARLELEAPETVPADGVIVVTLNVLDEAGQRVKALLPVEIELRDAAGRCLDGAGFRAAENGMCKVRVPVNRDDAPGDWQIVCRDRASGLSVVRTIARYLK